MSERMRPPTLYDVARAAGVSHQTVSRYVQGFTGIRPATKERVEAAIAELGYRPNLVARSLATQRSRRIVALVQDLLEVGPSRTLAGASAEASAAGYVLDIVSLDPDDPRAALVAVERLGREDLAGVLTLAATAAVRDALAGAGIPAHAVTDAGARPAGPDNDLVGVSALVDHLVALGHRRLAHVTGPLDWLSASNRAAAVESVVAERRAAGLALEIVATASGDWSAASGYAVAAAWPDDLPATAVLADNDQMALGVLRALAERGIAVPERVSVVGFDDMPEAEYFSPPLTTIAIDFALQGRHAVRRLLGALAEATSGQEAGEARAPDARPLPPVTPALRIRSSTAPPPPRA